jgi:hypothetical protein
VSATHKLINSLWNKEELPHQWKESVIIPIHEKDDKTVCNDYRGIPPLSTTSNILLSMLSPYIDEIIVDYKCGFRRNR